MISVNSPEIALFLAVLLSAVATFITRWTPFILMKNFSPSAWLVAVQRYMGLMIMTLLVCYCLKGTQFGVYPHGASEILGVITAAATHLKFKNMLLSIVLATGVYMICIRILV